MSSAKNISVLILGLVLTSYTGCNQVTPNNDPVIKPANFDENTVKLLACPENLTPLRLAHQSELATINDRIERGTLKHWDGSLVSVAIQAALMREDGKIAYKIDNGIPVMLIEQALVLDERIGPPQPNKQR
jgi:uncharacterized protein YbaR (Trm112 family)